ncbi:MULTISPECIES: sensor histidine kinase [Kitasatospora]|uniref:sensor histidine kinase n=1 Tax=Kitasatospora TaxID=2063 RepID=UPI0022849AB2|nr:sensor histidine kinase [Kitasatospora sp. YST-16]WAL73527.1 sensor histidine kinase [Kitasatospora sp. YST-16]WNW39583.1 sensor histidine kinase [Streptomyces sp. Li-HN-5-13]
MSEKPSGDGPWWWARRRGAALDVALAAVSAAECAAGAYGLVRDRLGWGLPATAVCVALGALAGASLVVRRRWPVVPVVVALVFVPGFFGVVLLVVSLYTLAATWEWPSRRARVLVLSAVAMAETFGMVLFATTAPSKAPPAEPLPPTWVFVVISAFVAVGMAVAPMVTGLYVGARRRLVESLKDRAQGLEGELSLLADQARERAWRARVEERTRIAREMHDVVAHRVSLMVVHAAAVERIVPKDPARAQQSARLIGETGRQALDELREILGVLRMTEPQEQVEAPVGGLAELPELVEQSRVAGMAVTLTVSGERLEYVAEAEQTAYRVVQEGLTNAHKYAGGARVAVLLAYVPNGVRVSVVNECPGGVAPVALPSGGNGLVGMRERVVALGGAFHAGREDGGGFRVEAVLPSRLRRPAAPA